MYLGNKLIIIIKNEFYFDCDRMIVIIDVILVIFCGLLGGIVINFEIIN